MSVDDLANYIYDLFMYEFGIPTFEKSLDECRIIATRINNTGDCPLCYDVAGQW